MPEEPRVRAPLLCRGFVRAASWMVPFAHRAQWHARWQEGLESWWALVECGGQSSRTAQEICRVAWKDAVRLRCGTGSPDRLVRSAAFVPAVALLLTAAIAVISRGFPATRLLLDAARGRYHGPLRTLALTGAEDRLVGHSFVIGFALAVGLVVALMVGLPLHRRGWRYWGFLVLKSLCTGMVVTLVWLEGAPMLRARLPNMELKALAGGLGAALAYVAAFGWAMAWSVKDQRARCPVCLRRLAMPVRMGSWASTFDPPTTELLCDAGHGRLCVSETADGEVDRWTQSDATWQELFQPSSPPPAVR